MSVADRLSELGITLPVPATPVFSYVPVVVYGGMAFVSGQLPKVDGEVKIRGKVGAEVSVEEAQEAARICVLQGLACLQAELGSLDRVTRVVKVTGFVQSAPGFDQQPKVVDAASDLLLQVFGPRGKHSRSAVGVAELPRRTPVEIEFIFGVD